MKTTLSFISNSSSSSFILHLDELTVQQYKALISHKVDSGNDDEWCILEDGNIIECSCSMDNFDLEQYLIDHGVENFYNKEHN